MTLINFVTQFWVFLLTFVAIAALMVIAVGARRVWKEKHERPIEMDEAHRQRLEERLLQLSGADKKIA